MDETLPTPRVDINDEQPLETVELREHPVFETADSDRGVPDVLLGSAPLNPRDRPRPHTQRVGINDTAGNLVGAFNLVQKDERAWVNDVRIEDDRKNEKLAVSAYLGVIAAFHSVGRTLESDPGGLSDDSVRVWKSLTQRGVAQQIEGEFDQHEHPRFVAAPPEHVSS